jgi:hypothetical protein
MMMRTSSIGSMNSGISMIIRKKMTNLIKTIGFRQPPRYQAG